MDLYQSLVTVNPVTLIAQICNLFITLAVVKIFFLDKIKAILDQRREAADKEITDAEADEIRIKQQELLEENQIQIEKLSLKRLDNSTIKVKCDVMVSQDFDSLNFCELISKNDYIREISMV